MSEKSTFCLVRERLLQSPYVLWHRKNTRIRLSEFFKIEIRSQSVEIDLRHIFNEIFFHFFSVFYGPYWVCGVTYEHSGTYSIVCDCKYWEADLISSD